MSSSATPQPPSSKNSKSRFHTTSLDANQLRSRHLYNLIHSTSISTPLNKLYSLQFDKLNSTYGITTKAATPASSLVLNHKICHACGVLLVPGVNVSIRIKYRNNKSKKRENKSKSANDSDSLSSRRLRFRCLSCGDKTYEPLLDGSEKQRNTITVKSSNKDKVTSKTVETPEPSSSNAVELPQSNQSVNSKLDLEETPESEANTIATNTGTATTAELNQPNSKNKLAKQRAKKRKAELNLLSNLKHRKTDQSSKLDSLNLSDFLK